MGDSFVTRLVAACRSAAASVIVAGERTAAGVAAASEFVEAYSGLPCPPDRLSDDLVDPMLAFRLAGDLLLVAEDLRPDAARQLHRGLADLAAAADEADGSPARARQAVLAACAEHLGIA